MDYRAYGLNVASELELPGLPRGSGPVDVRIRFGPIDPGETTPMGYAPGRRRASPSEACLVYDDIGTILVREGREVVLQLESGATTEDLLPFVLGPALGLVLVQRGRLTLHGSAVARDARAILFLGGPGWGKSTTAGAFEQRGYRLITDDISAVDRTADCDVVQPGTPLLKLWEEAAAALGHDFGEMRTIRPALNKRTRTLRGSFDDEPVPLEAIYVLAWGPSVLIEPLSGVDAVTELIRHSYAPSFMRDSGLGPAHLRRCAELVAAVPIRRLVRSRSLGGLTDIVAAVEASASAHAGR